MGSLGVSLLFQGLILALVEGLEIRACADFSAAFFFELTAGISCNGSSGTGGPLVFRKASRVLPFGDLGGGGFTEHGKNEFQVRHVVAQVFLGILKCFESFVFRGCQAKSGFANLGGGDGELFALFDTALFPFIGQFIASGNAAQALFNPIFGVAFLLVDGSHPFGNQLWILDLFQTLVTDAGKPAFERLCFAGRNGLDEPEKLLGVRHIDQSLLANGSGHFQSVTICNGLIAFPKWFNARSESALHSPQQRWCGCIKVT